MGWIFAYKVMLFAGVIFFAVISWRLFIRPGEDHAVVEEFALWKLFTLKKPHAGTVFAAMSMACFIVMVTTKSSWKSGDGGEYISLLSDMDEYEPHAEFDTVPYEEFELMEMAEMATPYELDVVMGQSVSYEELEMMERDPYREIIMKGGPDPYWDDDDSAEDEDGP